MTVNFRFTASEIHSVGDHEFQTGNGHLKTQQLEPATIVAMVTGRTASNDERVVAKTRLTLEGLEATSELTKRTLLWSAK